MATARSFEEIETAREEVRLGYARGAPVPWWLKLGTKIVLSRLPIDYRTWARLGLSRHSRSGGERARLLKGARKYIRSAEHLMDRPPRAVVELGPGDSVGRAVVAAALGIERTYLIDSGDFARADLAHYTALARDLEAAGLNPPDLSGIDTREDVLSRCNAEYLTDGVESFARIEAGCIDLVFSQVVLEHLPYREFDRFLNETHRVLRPGALAMHSVDLHDHLGGKLESLRFSHESWEAPFMRDSGFYTNRLRYPDIVSRCEAAGLETKVPRLSAWPSPPIARRQLDPAFAEISDEDLAVCAFDLILRKPAN